MQHLTTRIRLASLAVLALAVPRGAAALDSHDYDCLIEPHSVVEVSTRETGVLEAVLAERGATIEQGQALARLESGVEEVAVAIARARAGMYSTVESKQAELKYLLAQQARIDELHEKKAIPLHEKEKAATDVALIQAELKEAKDNYALAKLEKQRAEQILERRTIHSLIDGVVVDVLVDPGELVDERPIMTIADVDPLNVEVILPDDMYGLVKVGTRAEIQPHINGAEKRISEVVIVDKVIDAASNTFGVRLELANPDFAIPGGIRCGIEFLTDTAGTGHPDG
jgi:RND family efflux transporter MFP subunit